MYNSIFFVNTTDRLSESDYGKTGGNAMDSDTIKLLKECDAGIKMGITSIQEVLDDVCNQELKAILEDYEERHEKMQEELEDLLKKFHDEGKEPNPMAKGMSWIKTNMKLMMEPSDETVAELMTDGCDMGVKSLNKYLNQYKAADRKAKSLTEQLIQLEECFSKELREYL